jgi:hypothetical protein
MIPEELAVGKRAFPPSVRAFPGLPGPVASPLEDFRRLTVAQFEGSLNRVAKAFLDVLAREGLECEDVGPVNAQGLAFRILMVPAYEVSLCLYRPEVSNATYVAVQGLGREPDEVTGILIREVGELLGPRGRG